MDVSCRIGDRMRVRFVFTLLHVLLGIMGMCGTLICVGVYIACVCVWFVRIRACVFGCVSACLFVCVCATVCVCVDRVCVYLQAYVYISAVKCSRGIT